MTAFVTLHESEVAHPVVPATLTVTALPTAVPAPGSPTRANTWFSAGAAPPLHSGDPTPLATKNTVEPPAEIDLASASTEPGNLGAT